MEEAASSRRAHSKLGDFSFSICAAVLGLALLFAAGRHLFVPLPAIGRSQPATVGMGVGQIGSGAGAAALGVPLTVGVPATVAVPAAPHRRVAPVTHVGPATQARQASQVSPALQSRVTLQRSAHGPNNSKRLVGLLRPTPILHPGRRAAIARFAAIVHAARPAPLVHVARPAPVLQARFARPARVASGVKTRALGPVRSRSDPRRANRNVVAHATSATSNRALAQTSRAAKRARATRQRAIIEPPLGYEAQPPLVLAPAAVALDLGIPIAPSIRSRRHH